jgi:hypothetical protein
MRCANCYETIVAKQHKCTYIRQYHGIRPYIRSLGLIPPNCVRDPVGPVHSLSLSLTTTNHATAYWDMYERETTASTIEAGGTMNGEFTGKFFVFRFIDCSIRQCYKMDFVCVLHVQLGLAHTHVFFAFVLHSTAGLSGGQHRLLLFRAGAPADQTAERLVARPYWTNRSRSRRTTLSRSLCNA